MSYKYLDDGTPFSAEELNDRVSSAADEVNSLDASSLGFGALRTEHLPQLIGPSGFAEGEFTKFVANRNGDFDPSRASNIYTFSQLPVNVTYDTPIGFADRRVSAFIVLFNANVARFWSKFEGTFHSLSDFRNEKNEDFITATFKVYVDIEWAESSYGPGGIHMLQLDHTTRAVSPGFTFFGTTAPAGEINREPGSAFRTDDYSNRDIALRTVVRTEDMIRYVYGEDADAALIANIKVKGFGIIVDAHTLHSGTSQAVRGDTAVEVTKMNLTVIPIQAKVISMGA